MLDVQNATGGLPVPESPADEVVGALLAKAGEPEETEQESTLQQFSLKHQSLARPSLRPITLGNWMFEAVANLTWNKDAPRVSQPPVISEKVPVEPRQRRPSSIHIDSLPQTPRTAYTFTPRRLSLQFSPTSPTFPTRSISSTDTDDITLEERAVIKRTASEATMKRRAMEHRPRARWDEKRLTMLTNVKLQIPDPDTKPDPDANGQSFWSLIRDVYPTVPHKHMVLFGICVCFLSGAMTPLFSYLLSRLMFEVSIGATRVTVINAFGGIVLGMAALDGFFMGLKYFVMETAGAKWVERIRTLAFTKVLAQDKKWFDRTENAPTQLVQTLIKDGDDARSLIAVVLGQFCVVIAMVGIGLIWALIRGWQLTLVGFAIAPVFAVTMAIQTSLVAKCEGRNKRAREDVAKGYYEVSIRNTLF
jgi:ATP-binding cassette subfamily B (MDR/TAP) protein 1